MTTLLVSTWDGLHLIDDSSGTWVDQPMLAGHNIAHAVREQSTGTLWAASNRGETSRVMHSEDGGATWEAGPDFAAEEIWHVDVAQDGAIWAGVKPAALLVSRDRGTIWAPNLGLNEHPSRKEWHDGGAGLILHTMILPPERPNRRYVAISVAGLFRSDDGGETWVAANDGTRGFGEGWSNVTGNPLEHPEVHRCVHKTIIHPTNPEVLFSQTHMGVYRSDDGGANWGEIEDGLPTIFCFGIAAQPVANDAGCALFIVPQSDETLRTTDGLIPYRSLDGGRTWEAKGNGLPSGDHMVLRDAMAADAAGVYFGNSQGTVWATRDLGETWQVVAEGLGRVQAVEIG
ncbi:MAG: WD40/YVTN/BNR-like repeat-containing protein [Chloroflexota bacterium]